MAAMIDYAVLCRAIEDWKAGHAPRVTASRPPPRPSRPVAAPVDAEPEVEEPVEEIAEQQAPEDRTIIYAMPEIVDEGEGEGEIDAEGQVEEEN
jgi:hypothetical protein